MDIAPLSKRFLELSFVLASQIFGGVSALILLKILVVHLSPALYGEYALMMSVVAVASALPFNGLNQSVLRFSSGVQGQRNQYLSYVISSLFLYFLLLIFYFFIVCGIYFFLNNPVWKESIFALYAYFFGSIVFSFSLFIYNGNRLRGKVFFLGLVSSLLSIGLLLYFLREPSHRNLKEVFILIAIGYFVAPIVTVGRGWGKLFSVQWKLTTRHFLMLFKFAGPLILMSGFIWFRSMASRWYLDFFVNKEAIASFAILSTLAMMAPTALQSFLSSYFSPILYQLFDRDEQLAIEKLKKITKIFFIFLILSAIVVAVASHWIIRFFAAGYYAQHAWMLMPMYLSFSIYTLISFSVTTRLFAEKKPGRLVLPNVLIDIISLLAGALLTFKFGLMGVFINYCATYLILAFLLYGLLWGEGPIFRWLEFKKIKNKI